MKSIPSITFLSPSSMIQLSPYSQVETTVSLHMK